MPKTTADLSERDRYLLNLVQTEINQWEEELCFVTENVAFEMREMIKVFRKNYYGIFDKPVDSSTGKKKIWVPLTESTVDSVRKNIDLDTKDINLRAKRHSAIGLTQVVRNLVQVKLDDMHFGEKLDKLITNVSIDGTAIWKTFLRKKGKRKYIDVVEVDTLNLYIDPTAKSLQEATFIERAALLKSEMDDMDGWEKMEDVNPDDNISRNQRHIQGVSGVELIDVYERWGQAPKWIITGEKDDNEMIDVHVVVSGIDTKGGTVHLVEENKEMDNDGNVLTPYEECWYSRVPGRWYGRGPAEKVMFLQVWLNTIVNIRINRSRVSQLGIFKLRKGSGVSPQVLSGLAANGVIQVNSMDDLQQLPIQEASQASYNDENVIKNWAQMVTSTFESATGEALPASMPATNAVLQSQAAQGQFILVKEQIGMFLQRWMKNQFLRLLPKVITKEEVLRVSGETEEMKDMDEKVANKLVYEKLREVIESGQMIDPAQVQKERDRVMAKLEAMGPDRFIKLMSNPDFTSYDVQVFITNEEQDKGVMVQNLVSMFQTASVQDTGLDPLPIAETIYDLMGIDAKQFKRKQTSGMAQAQMPAAPQVAPVASPQQQFTGANVPV